MSHLLADRSALLTALALLGAVTFAGCGDDASDAGTATPAASSASAPAADEASAATSEGAAASVAVHNAKPDRLKEYQTDLKIVGCYGGAIDATLGPQTQAAIRAFQAGKGLTVDGQLGAKTEPALTAAAAANETVCKSVAAAEAKTASGRSTGGGTGQATLASSSYGKTFTISSCSLNPDLNNLALQGSAGSQTLSADAPGGAGTVAVTGGNESDGVTLNGSLTKVTIGTDRSFTASGKYTDPSFAGQSFTLHGSCPE